MTALASPSLDAADAHRPAADGASAAAAPPAVLSTSDLREVIEAYHAVTERLQHSHETLQQEVLRLRRELASADAQLQRSKRLAALGEMAAGIAHEVRNPLAAIGLYAEMIGNDAPLLGGHALADGVRTNAGRIGDAVRGLSAVVNDVLSFSRQVEPDAKPIAVRDLISRVLEAHRPELQRQGVEVEVRLGVDSLFADAGLLQQALLNLLRNAVDAMQDGEGGQTSTDTLTERRIQIEFDRDDSQDVRICIADRGPGIADDAVDRIFNPFFTTRSTGTGLGLAIVHRIIDAHGGSIGVHNDPGHGGAVFTLTLPGQTDSPIPATDAPSENAQP